LQIPDIAFPNAKTFFILHFLYLNKYRKIVNVVGT
jgi:hypothetical protein